MPLKILYENIITQDVSLFGSVQVNCSFPERKEDVLLLYGKLLAILKPMIPAGGAETGRIYSGLLPDADPDFIPLVRRAAENLCTDYALIHYFRPLTAGTDRSHGLIFSKNDLLAGPREFLFLPAFLLPHVAAEDGYASAYLDELRQSAARNAEHGKALKILETAILFTRHLGRTASELRALRDAMSEKTGKLKTIDDKIRTNLSRHSELKEFRRQDLAIVEKAKLEKEFTAIEQEMLHLQALKKETRIAIEKSGSRIRLLLENSLTAEAFAVLHKCFRDAGGVGEMSVSIENYFAGISEKYGIPAGRTPSVTGVFDVELADIRRRIAVDLPALACITAVFQEHPHTTERRIFSRRTKLKIVAGATGLALLLSAAYAVLKAFLPAQEPPTRTVKYTAPDKNISVPVGDTFSGPGNVKTPGRTVRIYKYTEPTVVTPEHYFQGFLYYLYEPGYYDKMNPFNYKPVSPGDITGTKIPDEMDALHTTIPNIESFCLRLPLPVCPTSVIDFRDFNGGYQRHEYLHPQIGAFLAQRYEKLECVYQDTEIIFGFDVKGLTGDTIRTNRIDIPAKDVAGFPNGALPKNTCLVVYGITGDGAKEPVFGPFLKHAMVFADENSPVIIIGGMESAATTDLVEFITELHSSKLEEFRNAYDRYELKCDDLQLYQEFTITDSTILAKTFVSKSIIRPIRPAIEFSVFVVLYGIKDGQKTAVFSGLLKTMFIISE